MNAKFVKIAKKAFHESVPVMSGYVPSGIIFGILFNQLGGHWLIAGLSGLIVYAGAAQFLSIELYKSNASFATMFFTIFLLNIRHVFYGFSFLRRYKKVPLKPYLIFGLTDETYSVLTSKRVGAGDSRYCLILTAFHHFYWVLGCILGAFIGNQLRFDTTGFEFVLTALFTVLTVEQWLSKRRWFPFLIGALASILSLMFLRNIFLVAAMLTAALSLIFYSRFERPHESR